MCKMEMARWVQFIGVQVFHVVYDLTYITKNHSLIKLRNISFSPMETIKNLLGVNCTSSC